MSYWLSFNYYQEYKTFKLKKSKEHYIQATAGIDGAFISSYTNSGRIAIIEAAEPLVCGGQSPGDAAVLIASWWVTSGTCGPIQVVELSRSSHQVVSD